MYNLGSHSGVSVRLGRQDSCSEEPGRFATYENGGRVVQPGTIAVLLQDVPGKKGGLFIRYPDLVRTMYCSPFGI